MIFTAKHLTPRNLLFGILIIAFLIRFWGAGNYDLFGDEAVDAFRGVGYIDYLGTSFQTQPIDWYKDTVLPWWTKLSFHDFPPLAMIIQHIFFAVFGDTILAARLPAIVFGTVSAYLMFLIVRRLFSNANLALVAAFLFSINSVMVWIFRTSLLEPILIFFIILNIYWFLRFIQDKKYWWVFGLTLGFVALTKYIGAFLLPVYLSYWAYGTYQSYWSNKSNWFDKSDWNYLLAALGLALLLFSPVIIYNFYLYQATGHFDLQFAYFLGQETPEWIGLVGKIQAPFSEIWRNFTSGVFYPVASYRAPFLLMALGGLLYSVFWLRQSLFFWLYLIFYTLLLIKIGSAHRFLAIYGPAFVFFASLAVWRLWEWPVSKKAVSYFIRGMVILFIAWEVFYSINKNFFQMPDYGMAKLDRYFIEEFKHKESGVIPQSDNPHLNKLINDFARKKSEKPRELFMIVYNENVALPTLEWIFFRRFFYHNTPALFVENFQKAVAVEGEGYFKDFEIYFVQSAEHTLLNPLKLEKTSGLEFENQLIGRGFQPIKIIYGHRDLEMFRIYKFRI